METQLTVERILSSGQGLGTTKNGDRVAVWNALPDERVLISGIQKKKGIKVAQVEKILTPHPWRVEPKELHFNSCSPWQIVSPVGEKALKEKLVRDLFSEHSIMLPQFELLDAGRDYGYRNKIEFSFTQTETGELSLAFFERGGKKRLPISSCLLASSAMNELATNLVQQLQSQNVLARSLKSLFIRENQQGEMLAGLFLKDTIDVLLKTSLHPKLVGISLIYSDPKSPFAKVTEILAQDGRPSFLETIGTTELAVSLTSFFQVNVPAFGLALECIKQALPNTGPVIDFYAGVGTIGLSLNRSDVTLVESELANILMARENAKRHHKDVRIIESSAEKILDEIKPDAAIIFDPPRVGLHPKVLKQTVEVKPASIIYLSCNPQAQARDVAALINAGYKLQTFHAFNFFPKTPHVETLTMLSRN